MTLLTPDGFITLADAVQNAVRIAQEFDFKRVNDQQAAHKDRLQPSDGPVEREAYDETDLLSQAETLLQIGYWWEWPDRLQNWWAWLRRELFVGSLDARSYSTFGDFQVIPKEFWGGQAAEYVYVVGDMSVAGTRPAYGPAYLPIADLSNIVVNALTGNHGSRPDPPQNFEPDSEVYPTRSAQVKSILTTRAESTGLESIETMRQGLPGAPRRFDGEQFLIEAFHILWNDHVPLTQAKFTELALNAYAKKGLLGGVPTVEWAKPKIRKLWVALNLGSNSRD